ncbi:alpha/beta hydrolase [Candidatus Shapirobacteria bacterium]|nr:alpha/beta hydrolase [Candidatus Shapirobacteria bacterium]
MSKDITKGAKVAIFKEAEVKVGDTVIHYATSGKGRPLVFVHGWTNNWKGFIPMARYLYKEYQFIGVDLPGFGDSDRLDSYNLRNQADYLAGFIKSMKIKKPVVVGHSMGAYVVSTFYSRHPKVASHIILIAPMFLKNNKTAMVKVMGVMYRLLRKSKLAMSAVKRIVDTKRYTYFTAKHINMYKFDKKIIDETGFEGKLKASKEVYVDMGMAISKTHIDDLIENNTIPIDLIFGKFDKLTNATQARKLLDGRGKYHIEEVDEAGHVLTVEKPEETAEAVERLIEERD